MSVVQALHRLCHVELEGPLDPGRATAPPHGLQNPEHAATAGGIVASTISLLPRQQVQFLIHFRLRQGAEAPPRAIAALLVELGESSIVEAWKKIFRRVTVVTFFGGEGESSTSDLQRQAATSTSNGEVQRSFFEPDMAPSFWIDGGASLPRQFASATRVTEVKCKTMVMYSSALPTGAAVEEPLGSDLKGNPGSAASTPTGHVASADTAVAAAGKPPPLDLTVSPRVSQGSAEAANISESSSPRKRAYRHPLHGVTELVSTASVGFTVPDLPDGVPPSTYIGFVVLLRDKPRGMVMSLQPPSITGALMGYGSPSLPPVIAPTNPGTLPLSRPQASSVSAALNAARAFLAPALQSSQGTTNRGSGTFSQAKPAATTEPRENSTTGNGVPPPATYQFRPPTLLFGTVYIPVKVTPMLEYTVATRSLGSSRVLVNVSATNVGAETVRIRHTQFDLRSTMIGGLHSSSFRDVPSQLDQRVAQGCNGAVTSDQLCQVVSVEPIGVEELGPLLGPLESLSIQFIIHLKPHLCHLSSEKESQGVGGGGRGRVDSRPDGAARSSAPTWQQSASVAGFAEGRATQAPSSLGSDEQSIARRVLDLAFVTQVYVYYEVLHGFNEQIHTDFTESATASGAAAPSPESQTAWAPPTGVPDVGLHTRCNINWSFSLASGATS